MRSLEMVYGHQGLIWFALYLQQNIYNDLGS